MQGSFNSDGSLAHVLRRLNQATHLAAPLSLEVFADP